MQAEEDAIRVPVIQQLLEVNLRQGQVNQKIAKVLPNLHLAPAATVPIPDLRLLMKLSAN